MGLKRRTFLAGIGAAALASTLMFKESAFAFAACSSDTFFKHFKARKAASMIGAVFLKTHKKAPSLEVLSSLGCAQAHLKIQNDIERDFENKKFVRVNDWILPETSVKLSALIYKNDNS